MYPLRFQPAFRRYIWGGRRLADVLTKSIGDQSAAESWEIVDHGDDQSVVQFGSLAGRSLHELVIAHGADLVGQQVWQRINDDKLPAALRTRFPLLLKFLDANRDLSVQVHPDDRPRREGLRWPQARCDERTVCGCHPSWRHGVIVARV